MGKFNPKELKSRAIAWRSGAAVHKVRISDDDKDRILSKTALCGQKIPYGEVWDIGDKVTCKKCMEATAGRVVRYLEGD